MLTPQDRVLVGVSGGADSTALALVLKELGYAISIAHLNHGLRGAESDEDQLFVEQLAKDLDANCFTRSVVITKSDGNIEAAGREARRQFFESLRQTHQFTKVALAHNREDRMETFLLHLMRGAGTEGLVSMAPVGGYIVRPLIETPRADIEAYLTSKRKAWRTDATNADMSFARNRMRLEILPRLASLFNTRLVEALSRTISVLDDEDQWMKQLAKTWLRAHSEAGGVDVQALRETPVALARRVIREALQTSLGHLKDVSFDHVEAVRGLLEDGKSGKSLDLPGGAIVAREFNRLVFTEWSSETRAFSYDLPIPGCVRIPELGRSFSARYVDKTQPPSIEGTSLVFVDGSGLGACVKIRNWKPGDYYRPAGWPAGKVKKLFQKARIPRSQRSRWPILASESAIIWVTSFPVSREFVPSPCAKKIVAFEALEG
jgi:tRNA(Ile)-lysidine synthase